MKAQSWQEIQERHTQAFILGVAYKDRGIVLQIGRAEACSHIQDVCVHSRAVGTEQQSLYASTEQHQHSTSRHNTQGAQPVDWHIRFRKSSYAIVCLWCYVENRSICTPYYPMEYKENGSALITIFENVYLFKNTCTDGKENTVILGWKM